MLTLFGGSIADLTTMLTEERFPPNWEPRVLSRFGLTMAKFNGTVIPVQLGVNTKKIEELEAAAGVSGEGNAAPPTAMATAPATAPATA
jgi:hypothetical protein